MRTIRRVKQFTRDYRRERSAPHGKKLDNLVAAAVGMLVNDQALPYRFHDHMLSGKWKNHRGCHILPDLLLIYRKPNDHALELVRLGSRSELGL